MSIRNAIKTLSYVNYLMPILWFKEGMIDLV